jgi:anaerobic magnesium-protoporphyrin IX monomethyl ester cyclase
MEKREFRILLINPPSTSIDCRIPLDKLPPHNLLCVTESLIEAGFRVELLNADFAPMPPAQMVDEAMARAPRVVMLGHADSTSAHATMADIAAAIKERDPSVLIIYCGAFPACHWHDILRESPQFDVIVRGDSEKTTLRLVNALFRKKPIFNVAGIALNLYGNPHATADAASAG